MKKLVSSILSLILVLSMVSVALAVPFTLETAGVTIEVPEGMTGEDQSDEDGFLLSIAVEGNEALHYAYFLKYIEEFEGRQLQDLSDEEGEQLLQGVAAALENPSFGAAELETYPVLLAASGDGTQLHYLSLLNGWLCDVAVGKSDGVALTDAEIEAAAKLLVSIQFEETADAEDEAGEE